ncbi:MAG TPA: hypothetical protein VMC05_03450 [Xanthobacteraceae bacterium]|nr:hypothetical protein [Xanthobacteraceae bacterium]
MYRKDSINGPHKDSVASIDALAMLIEYALLESREIRLPLVTFLLKMARNAIQQETMSDLPLTVSPDGLDEARICPLWTDLTPSAD